MYSSMFPVSLLRRASSLLALASVLIMAACSGAGQMAATDDAPASAVARVADEAVSLKEFEDRYARSIGSRPLAAADSLASYRDFLERYTEFLMKVRYAEELGFAADSALQNEIEEYRKQLARPYLIEREILDPILRTLYERRQKIVDASHILLRVGQEDPPADTLAAHKRLSAIRDSILAGADFGELAFRHSEDPSARGAGAGARGRLGYFSAGQMVQSFEDMAYTTAVDSVSRVFRSQFGYHILFVHDLRDRVLDRWASHIAVRNLPRGVADTTTPPQRIAEILARLKAGEDFRVVAREKSEDTETGSRGGVLGRIAYTTPQLPESFKNALFALEKPGDFSEVIETAYGLHIVRLDQIEEPQTFEQSYEDLKLTASRLPRTQVAQDRRAAQIRQNHGVFVDTTTILAILRGRPFNARDILETPADTMALRVIGIGDQRYPFKDMVDFAETVSMPYTPDTLARVMRTIDLFLNNAALDFEASQLETTSADFRMIMDEFRDGLLLFKLMEDSIWSAAAQDTVALMAYHNARADSFWFPDRTRVISLKSASDSSLTALTAHLEHGLTMAALLELAAQDSAAAIQVDTTYLAGPNNSIYDRALAVPLGRATTPILNANSFIVLINDGIDAARRKTFDEARSEVLSAYQSIKEEALLNRLRKAYRVELFPDRLSAAFAEEKRKAAIAAIPSDLDDTNPAND
jgi:peptidyl-prolyl cis-trans isomerase SurA